METVTISVEKYNALIEAERKVASLERQLHSQTRELDKKVKNLYILESHANNMRGGSTVRVRIDRLNLLGLLGLNLDQEGVSQVLFEFSDRGIFLDDGMRR